MSFLTYTIEFNTVPTSSILITNSRLWALLHELLKSIASSFSKKKTNRIHLSFSLFNMPESGEKYFQPFKKNLPTTLNHEIHNLEQKHASPASILGGLANHRQNEEMPPDALQGATTAIRFEHQTSASTQRIQSVKHLLWDAPSTNMTDEKLASPETQRYTSFCSSRRVHQCYRSLYRRQK